MASRTKTSSHVHSMFGNFCRPYRCFVSRRDDSDKKHSPWYRRKFHKSTDETCSKTSNDKSEERTSSNDTIHELRSPWGNDDNPNSPHKQNSRSSSLTSSSKSPSLLRSSGTLSGNLSRQSVETPKAHPKVSQLKSGPLYRSSSSHRLETKSRGRIGLMAQSGPLLGAAVSRKEGPAPIMYSKSNGLVKLLAVEESIECTLEELCFGCVKRITVSRAVIANNRQIIEEEDTLSIKVKPGWTRGTKITFEGTKNEEKGTHSCDVIFVITEQKHELYRRDKEDLELVLKISLLQALTGCTLSIPLLGGDKMSLTMDEIIVPGYEKIIQGQGMHKPKEQGHRGNLKIKFLVDFPKDLTEAQRRDIASILQDSC